MPTTDQPILPDMTAPDYTFRKEIKGRDHFRLELAWDVLPSQCAVKGLAHCLNTDVSHEFNLELQGGASITAILDFVLQQYAAPIVVKLRLVYDAQQDQMQLKCEWPLSSSRFEIEIIGSWDAPFVPMPQPQPPEPFLPQEAEAPLEVIAAPHGSSDLFPFVWQPPLTARDAVDAELRFMRCADDSQLALYITLSGAGTAEAKRSAAQDFRIDPHYVGSLSSPSQAMAQVRARMLARSDLIPLDEQLALVLDWLALPEGQTLADFLQSQADTVANIWQTVYALALVGVPGDAPLLESLIRVLQGEHYLTLLAASRAELEECKARCLVLNATAMLADVIAAQPPQPGLMGGSGNTWQVLGVGQVSMARQHRLGYALGELADVVNVMPRERQESSERQVDALLAHDEQDSRLWREQQQDWQSSASSELVDVVAELMSADGSICNMTDVKPSYENLNLTLSGSWAGSNADARWDNHNRSHQVQRLMEQAAHQLGRRVNQRRSKEWQQFRERLQSQVIDNSQHERLVGLYHWIDQVVRVRLDPVGRRLILSFLMDTPASPWLAQVTSQGSVPLVKPAALPEPPAGQPAYSCITAANYQALGLQYDLLDLAPPPAATLHLVLRLDQNTPTGIAELVVPEYYKLDSGCYMALCDNGFDLACMLLGTTLSAITPTDPKSLSVIVPVCSSTSVDPAAVSQPAQLRTVVVTETLPATLQGATGRLQLVVLCAAPHYAVTVSMNCVLVDAAASASLFAQWQKCTYDRIYTAWLVANTVYEKELAARIATASAGHEDAVQRSTLKQSCLALLAQVSHTGTPERSLDELFSWKQMTWQYQSWPVGSPDSWPEVVPTEVMKSAQPGQFQHFLRAQSAQLMLPVAEDWAAWVLYYLQFQQYWAGGATTVPVTASTLALLELLQAPVAQEPPEPPMNWTLRLPTTLLYLQEDSRLPVGPQHQGNEGL